MCGRFSQAEASDHLARIFDAEVDLNLPPGKWNVAPTDHMRIVVEADEGRRILTRAEWGFRPRWRRRNGQPRPAWINAKSETAFQSPAFGPAVRQRRCIVPVDAFYEWDRGHRPPQPYAFGPAAEEGMLYLGGIWTQTTDDVVTCAILTIGPNELIAPLHDRMPVILRAADTDAWLASSTPLGAISSSLRPAPRRGLRMWPVSTAVNNVRHDGSHLLHQIDGSPSTLGLV